MPAAPTRRKSAAERREEIIAIALDHFATGGYRGASTDAIAREAGISQPYLFRLFRTKQELFLACNERACAKVIDVFRRAAATAAPDEQLKAMGHAYVEQLLPDRTAILMLMQGFVASSVPEIQTDVRRRYRAVVHEVADLTGATPPEVWRFFANGMLLNIVAALDLEQVAGEDEWAAAWAHPEALIADS